MGCRKIWWGRRKTYTQFSTQPQSGFQIFSRISLQVIGNRQEIEAILASENLIKDLRPLPTFLRRLSEASCLFFVPNNMHSLIHRLRNLMITSVRTVESICYTTRNGYLWPRCDKNNSNVSQKDQNDTAIMFSQE